MSHKFAGSPAAFDLAHRFDDFVHLRRFISRAKLTAARNATGIASAVDISAEFQDALDYCSQNKRALFGGSGYFKISSACTFVPYETDGDDFTGGLVFLGEGMGRLAFINAVAGAPMLTISASGTSGNFAKGCNVANLSVIGDGVSNNQSAIRAKGVWYSSFERVRVIKVRGTALLLGDDTATNPDTTANASNQIINCELDQNYTAVINPVNNNAPMISVFGGSMRNNHRGGIIANSSHFHIRGCSIAFNGFLDSANATGGIVVDEKTGTTYSAGYRTKDVIIEGCEFDTNYPSTLDVRTAEAVDIRNNGFMWHDYGTAPEIIAVPAWPVAQIILGGDTNTKRVIQADIHNNRVAILNEGNIANTNSHSILKIKKYAQNVKWSKQVYDIAPGAGKTVGTHFFIITEDSKAGTSPDLSTRKYHVDYDQPIANAPGSGVYSTTQNGFNVPFKKVFGQEQANTQYQLSIADDTAVSITVPNATGEGTAGANYGCFVITVAGQAVQSAVVLYRAASGPVCGNMGAAASNLTFSVVALTGTTGTDVKFNISAFTDGKIYLENRLGSTQTVNLAFLMTPGFVGQPLQ